MEKYDNTGMFKIRYDSKTGKFDTNGKRKNLRKGFVIGVSSASSLYSGVDYLSPMTSTNVAERLNNLGSRIENHYANAWHDITSNDVRQQLNSTKKSV